MVHRREEREITRSPRWPAEQEAQKAACHRMEASDRLFVYLYFGQVAQLVGS